MSVSDEVRELYKATNDSTVNKNYVMNIDGTDYDNTNIVMGSFSITEKLCSSQQLKYGECNAAMLKVKVVADIGDISEKKIGLSQVVNGNGLDIGIFNVDSCVLTENREYRDVVAYDNIILFNTNVSSWYNGLEFPINQKDMLTSLCAYVGVELADISLITGDVEIEKTISAEDLKGITVLKCIAELNAGFFRAATDGKIELVTLNTTGIDEYLEVKHYKSLKTETFVTNKITRLTIRTEEDDIGASSGDGDNAYVIEDNFLLYGSSTEKLKEIADIIYEAVKDISYIPYTAEQIGLPYLKCGSKVSYKLINGECFEGLILQRTLSGTQGLKDVVKTFGTKTTDETFGIEKDIIKLKNKTNRLKRTIEQTLLAVENLEEGLYSEINQTSEEISLLTKKVANMGDLGVTDIVIMYAISESSTEAPTENESDETSIWSPEAPPWEKGKYIWQKTVTTYNDGNVYESNAICITGADGKDGVDGADGKDGKGISNIVNYYLATTLSSGVTTSTSGWTTDVQTITSTKKYLWNYEEIIYTDSTSKTTSPAVIGVYGNTGATGADGKDGVAGADGKGIQSITEYYLASSASSGVTTSTSGWTTTMQTTTTSKKYLWNYEKITYTDGSTSTTTVRIIGTHGATGATGAAGKDGTNGSDGVGIKSIIEQYYQSTSATTQTGGSWSTAVPAWVNGKYMWTRSVITYTDDTITTTTPVCVTGAVGATGADGNTGEAGIGVKSVDVQYFLSTSSASCKNGTWSTEAPEWVDGKYMWSKTVTTYTDGTTSESAAVCITGAKGATGAAGADGKGIESVIEYYLATSASSGVTTSTSGWTTTIQTTTTTKKYLWNCEKTTYTDGTTSWVSPHIIGTHGETGATGADGKGIKSITEYYLASSASSGVTTSTSGWTTTIQTTTTSKKYLWNYEVITYTDGSTSTTTVRIIGTHGATGSTGATGATGKGIKSITEYYLASSASSGVTISTSGWTTTIQTTTTSKKYLWNYEVIAYTDGTTSTTTVRIIGTHGATGSTGATGATGKGIKSITEYYLASSASSGVTTSTSGWTTTIQTTTTSKKYLWNYEVITYTDGTTSTTTVRIIGTHGATGAAGTDGLTIKSIVPQYYVSTSKTSLTGGSWSTTAPAWSKGKYVWTRSVITYSDNTVSYSPAVCDASWEVANNIEAKLELKVDKETLVSELNAAADVIRLLANRLVIDSSYFKLGEDGKAEIAGGKIGSWDIGEALSSEAEAYVEPGEYERDRVYEYSLGNTTLNANELQYLDLNSDGSVNYKDILLIQKILLGVSEYMDCAGAAKSTVNVQLNPITPEKLIYMLATTPWGVIKETYLGINGLKCPKVISDAVSATTIEKTAGVNLDTMNSELTCNKGLGTHSFTAAGGYGYVTTNATEMIFYIPLNYPKSASARKSITITALTSCYIRTVQGTYAGGMGADLTSYVTNPLTYFYQGLLRLTLKKADGWGITNNTPVCGDVKIAYTME